LRVTGAVLPAFLLTIALVASANPIWAYAPQTGDSFNYSETTVVNNGQGVYTGYEDQTQTTGSEQVNSVSGSNVSSSYKYSFQFSDNQGNTTSGLSSGNFTWSSSSFTYLNGTDNQVGYSKPVYVWFAMDPSTPVGGTFYALNTQFTVLSKNYSFQLPTEGQYVQTIQAKGAGQYQRNDSYGVFTASYTWNEYFDPSTGYIVGYNYAEQDNGKYQGQVGSFTYTDDLYVTSTSYGLAPANAPSGGPGTTTGSTEATASGGDLVLGSAVILAIIVVVGVAAFALGRRRGRESPLPKHPPSTPPPAPSPAPWESKVDLGSTPPQQVVIRDVAKVNCRYCGTLIPTTAETCPYCGGPRR
jgi:hypothetical protein